MQKDLTPEQANAIFERWLKFMTFEKLRNAYSKMSSKNSGNFEVPKTERDSLKLRAERYLDSIFPPTTFFPC